MKRSVVLSAVCAVLTAASALASGQTTSIIPHSSRPWMDKSLSPLKRAELLVHEMTLDEKISQIHMIDTRQNPRHVSAVERLGIPALRVTNGPAGAGPGDSRPSPPATALPSALALSASWDPALAETFGRVAAEETSCRGESLLEAPGLNIIRVPQNGRNFEYFGEDPYLTARIGVAEIKGIQSQGIIAMPKHYAANSQETDRKTINEMIDERTLREIYLPAFEAAVKEGDAGSVMCAYPSVNGQFACENVHLLKDILRGEWGFKGFVQSDYTATHSTAPAALAGLDVEMKHDKFYDEDMKAAILKGELPESVVDTMLLRRFSTMFRLGLFDNPRSEKPMPQDKNGAIARSIAEQSAVLLKNASNTLPLRPDAIRSIAVIGPYAGAAHTGGAGSSAVRPLYTVTPVDGIKKHVAPSVAVNYIDGADLAAASKIAAAADIALVMVGNKDREGKDRPNLSLPDKQDELISAVAAANPRTIVVLKTGGPVLMPWLDIVPAVLEAWYPGEEDGNVVANILFGDVNPSGKLPVTFPKAENDTPAHSPEQYPGIKGTATYSEKLQVGYRWYDAQKITPLFPFGYGLSYTTFSFNNLTVSPSPDGSVRVALDVTNTGKRSGTDVVQVYVASPSEAGEPPKQLRGFSKVALAAGETKHVVINLDPRSFSIWDVNKNTWTTIPGQYRILAGDSSRDLPLSQTINIPRRSVSAK